MPRAASPPYGKNAWDGAVIFEVSGLVFIYVNGPNPFGHADRLNGLGINSFNGSMWFPVDCIIRDMRVASCRDGHGSIFLNPTQLCQMTDPTQLNSSSHAEHGEPNSLLDTAFKYFKDKCANVEVPTKWWMIANLKCTFRFRYPVLDFDNK